MPATKTSFFALLLITLLTIPAAAQPAAPAADTEPLVDNPLYAHWKKFPVGSTATIDLVTELKGQSQRTVMTKTLLLIADDKVVVEERMVIEYNKQMIDQPVRKTPIPARVPKSEAEQFTNPKGKVAQGQEELKIKGKPFKCTWFETEIKQLGATTKSKVWICDEMPGLVVKMRSDWKGLTPTHTVGVVSSYKLKG